MIGNYLEEISKNKTRIVCEIDIKMNSSLLKSIMAKEVPNGQKE